MPGTVDSGPFDPVRIPLKRPNAGELSSMFDAAREWVANLVRHGAGEDKPGFTIEWQENESPGSGGKIEFPKLWLFNTPGGCDFLSWEKSGSKAVSNILS